MIYFMKQRENESDRIKILVSNFHVLSIISDWHRLHVQFAIDTGQ